MRAEQRRTPPDGGVFLFSGADRATGGATCATFITSRPALPPPAPVARTARRPARAPACQCGRQPALLTLRGTPSRLPPASRLTQNRVRPAGPHEVRPSLWASQKWVRSARRASSRCPAHTQKQVRPAAYVVFRGAFWHAETGTPGFFFKFDSADGSACLAPHSANISTKPDRTDDAETGTVDAATQ